MPLVQLPDHPLINGHRFSFASIEAIFNGVPIVGITSINYGSELKAGDVYGSAPQKIGRTRGKHNAHADFEMLRVEWEVLRATLGKLGKGFGETSFDIIVAYAELPSMPVVTDTIVGCRIEATEHSNADGADPTKVKVTLSVMDVLYGLQEGSIVANAKGIGGI